MINVWDYDIDVGHCNVGLSSAQVSVRVFPIGNNQWEATEKKTEFNNLKQNMLLNGWTWAGAKTTAKNNFQFIEA